MSQVIVLRPHIDEAAIYACISKGVEEGMANLSNEQLLRMLKSPLEEFNAAALQQAA